MKATLNRCVFRTAVIRHITVAVIISTIGSFKYFLLSVYHYCSHDRMAIHVTPPVGFLGWVYVLDQEEDPACVFDADPEDTFTKELMFDSCGPAVEEINVRFCVYERAF